MDTKGQKIKKDQAIREQLAIIGVKEATDMLLRGFTSIRDAAGHANEVKDLVEKGKDNSEKLPAPRIWSSENAISSTGGHADFTGKIETFDDILSEASKDDYFVLNEALGGFVADGVAGMLNVTRQNFVLGADFIKITPGGGVSSPYDPIDATTMTADEIKAVVQVAKGFNTYVTAHAYEPSTINLLIDCGVKMVEHSNLIDDSTMKRIHGLNSDADPSNDFYVNISPFFPNAYANVKTGEGAIKKSITEVVRLGLTRTPRSTTFLISSDLDQT
jgi:imidazolonepropionase-like amidohydrolase